MICAREDGRVLGPVDPDGRHRHAGRHLHDRVERVGPAEVVGQARHADHRQAVWAATTPGRWAARPAPSISTL
jgi:hypothetical protein